MLASYKFLGFRDIDNSAVSMTVQTCAEEICMFSTYFSMQVFFI